MYGACGLADRKGGVQRDQPTFSAKPWVSNTHLAIRGRPHKERTSTEASTQMRGIYRPRLLASSRSPRAWSEPLCLERVRCCLDTRVFHKGWRGPLAIQRVRSPRAWRGMPRSPWQSDHPRASPREEGASGFLSSVAAPSTDGLVRGTSLRRSTHTPIPGCRRRPGIIIITSEVIEL